MAKVEGLSIAFVVKRQMHVLRLQYSFFSIPLHRRRRHKLLRTSAEILQFLLIKTVSCPFEYGGRYERHAALARDRCIAFFVVTDDCRGSAGVRIAMLGVCRCREARPFCEQDDVVPLTRLAVLMQRCDRKPLRVACRLFQFLMLPTAEISTLHHS